MQYNGEARKLLHYAVQYIECQRRRNQTACSGINVALFGFELICTVRSTDRNSQRVATGLGYEVNYFFRTGVGVMFSHNVVFYSGQYAQLTFYGYVELVSVFYDFLRQSHVLVIRKVRTVDHH